MRTSAAFDWGAIEELETIARMRRPLLGTISGGVVGALNRQEDAIRERLGCLSIGDAISHTTEVEISGERCDCSTCQLEAIRRTWQRRA